MQKGFRISISVTPVPTQLYKEKYNKVTNTLESAEYYLHTAAGQELAVLDLMQSGIYPMTLYAFGREREAKFETYYNTPSALGGDPDLPTEQRAANTCYGNGPAQFPHSLYRISDSNGRETYLFHSELPQPKPADWTLLQSLRAASADQRFFATFAEGKEAAAASIADILAWREAGLDFYLDGYDPACPMRTDTIEPFFTIPIPDPSFYIYDHLGNTRIVYHTDDMGAGCGYSYVVETLLDYYPYGKTLRSYSLADPERYVTIRHERDEETGYDYRGARYYDPDLFVFLSVDPMAEKYASESGYNYVAGNPVIFIDPTGATIDPTEFIKESPEYHNKLTEDLYDKTGVRISLDEKGLWKAESIDETIGSATARADLVNAINNTEVTVRIFTSAEKSSASGYKINFSGRQVEEDMKNFISNNPRDKEVVGYALNFIHELHHTALGIRERDPEELTEATRYLKGGVVERLNIIEAELKLPQRQTYFSFRVTIPSKPGVGADKKYEISYYSEEGLKGFKEGKGAFVGPRLQYKN